MVLFCGEKNIIHKTIQHWFNDVKYNDAFVKYNEKSVDPHSKVTLADFTISKLLKVY